MSRMRSLTLTGALLAATAVTTAACGAGGNAADDSKPTVMAAFYPLQWISQRVGGPDVSVTGLTKPGTEPHDLELTARQVADIQDSSLVVYIKGVQPAVDEAVQGHASGKAFDAAGAVSTLPATAEDEGHDEHDGHEHADVSYDPHIWLDPSRFAAVATQLGERLAAADPAHAAAYRQRAADTAAELNKVDESYRTGLATCGKKAIVTSHAAFGYLADRYGLEQISVSGIDPDAEPSPTRLAQVADVAKRKNVTTIFTEELVSPKVAEILAKEVGAATAVLNPLESEPDGGDYLSAAKLNLDVLRKALECPTTEG
ncbi:metal ABC transporter substrate-binding protein [Microtetraspora niveoalba]|uniref:metal ABC transporter substrate-binding protein n=1 Tax=Microtetraspora niveoalba TaxID=46175 RepID=UPI00082B8FF3|nr:metal ABC transporter substrate-binding protein [Microtetraspora niveoalba]